MAEKMPRLCRHKKTGRAYVTDPRTGKETYLGPWGSSESVERYKSFCHDLTAWREARDRGLPPPAPSARSRPLTVAALCERYLCHAETYYVKHGRQTNEVGTLIQVIRRLNDRHGELPARDYGPRHLRALRDGMEGEGLARGHINKQLHRVRRVWRWAVAEELLPPAALEALRAVPGLALGRTTAPEEEPVEPVPLDVVEATLPCLRPRRWADLVRFQLWAALRPGEAVVCRPCDVDRSSVPWTYRPWTHKTEHRGRERVVYLGPRARVALLPHLEACPRPDGWVWATEGRGPHRGKRGHLRENGYRQAVEAAVLRANADGHETGPPLRPVPHWYPLQLRHAAATAIRERHGLEGAQVILGHSEMNTSEIYAAKNAGLARRIAEDLG